MNAAQEIVLDIETQNSFSPVNKDAKSLKVSLVGVYSYQDDQYRVYFEKDLPGLFRLLEKADRLIGFNSKGFDLPVLNNYYPGDLNSFPSLDIMEKLVSEIGFRVSLDAVAKATLNKKKTSQGAEAIIMWREGRIDELKEYCLHDVKITKEIYEYGKKHGILKYENKLGKGEAKVDFAEQKEKDSSINLTLPI